MYSQPNLTGEIDWIAVVAETDSGARFRAPIERVFPALRDARYRRVVRQGFGDEPGARARCAEFLGAFLREANARAAPGERLRAVEAQRWHWNYARDPDDPAHGALTERIVVRASP
jgi:hypothetical protein